MPAPITDVGAGELDQRVRFDRKTRFRDAGGGWTEAWVQQGRKAWAKVVPMSGRERLMADQTESPANYRITLRRRSDLLPADRLVWLVDRGEVPMQVRFIALPPKRELLMTVDAEMGVAI